MILQDQTQTKRLAIVARTLVSLGVPVKFTGNTLYIGKKQIDKATGCQEIHYINVSDWSLGQIFTWLGI